jgi:membrane protease YdiL (CAAX protease family)
VPGKTRDRDDRRAGDSVRRRFARTVQLIVVLGVASEAVLFIGDRDAAYESLGLNAYLALLWAATARLVPTDQRAEDAALVAVGSRSRLVLRGTVVGATLLFVTFAYAFVANGVVRLPVLSPIWDSIVRARLPLGETAIVNPLLYALLPVSILVALGARPRELGFARWAPGTSRAAIAALALPLAMAAWTLFVHRHSLRGLAFIVARNFLSSGFSEEVLFRGLTLTHLRAFVATEWAAFGQALSFALFHVGSSVGEPGPLVLASYLFATSAVPGFLLGLIALRTRSLGLPVVIHTTLGMLKDLMR